jgi:putative membrane protein insertion efficiency factor
VKAEIRVYCKIGLAALRQKVWRFSHDSRAGNVEDSKAHFLFAPHPHSAHMSRMNSLLIAVKRLPRRFAQGLVTGYRYTLSPLVGFDCRHLPTCSNYADEAFGRFGFWAGGWMTAARLCRCHPLGTSGLDFVPEALPTPARWWMPWRYGRWRGVNNSGR